MYSDKIQQNQEEERQFAANLHRLLEGDKKLASSPLVIGRTPNVFAICSGVSGFEINTETDIVISKKTIDKIMRPEQRDENGRRTKLSGHFLSEEQIIQAIHELKNPVMVLKGSRGTSLVAITELKDDKGQEIIVPVEFNKVGALGEINNVTSIYGREEFANYIKENIRANNVIAANIEKANEMLLSIGVDFSEANTLISFNDSIAYSMENVNTPNQTTTQHKEETMPDIEKDTRTADKRVETEEQTEFMDSLFKPQFEGSFIDDEEKMTDFFELPQSEFLASYSYLTEAEYNATALDNSLSEFTINIHNLEEQTGDSVAEGCKAFNKFSAQYDMLESQELYYWDNEKNLKENLADCVKNEQTVFLYDWIDTHATENQNLHSDLESIEAAASAYRSENVHTAPLQGHDLQPENAVDELRDSVAQNVACSLAIKSGLSMMSEHINALGVLDKVVSEFGLDRTAAVVAAEISKRGNVLKLPAAVTEWAQEAVGKLPIQLTSEQKVDIDTDRLVEFAQTVMKAEAVRDSVQEVDTMDGLFEQLNEQFKRNQELASSVLTEESLKDRRAVEAMKLRNSMEHLENAAEQQSVTLPILKGLSEIQINKLNNLTQKQTELQNKNTFLENKGKRLEARAERLENTGKMLKALFPQRLPKPLQALADKMEKKAAVIRKEKIPKNNRRIDKNLRRMAVNDRKIEAAQCKVDKFQNISKIIKSFTVHDSTERKQQFTQALDGLHNASLRSMQIKLDKCEVKIDKLSQKYMDAEIFKKSEIMERLKAQTEKKSNLTEKIAKLSSLEKPFAEQSDKIVDDVMKTAEAEITAQEEAPERITMEDFADELCAACVDTVAEPPVQAKDKVNEATVEGNNQFDINEYDDPDYYEQQQISELEAKEQKQADIEPKETTQTNNMEDNQMVDKIKAIVGEEHFEEFLDVVSFNYPPDSWEDWENEIIDMAQLCSMWHSDKTVLEAREIADTLPGIEFMRNPKFGIQTPAQYNNVISDFPRWDKYSDTSSLSHYAKKVVEKYGYDLAEIKEENAKSSAEKKPSVLDNIKDIKSEQSKEQKSAPNQGQKKARSNEAEI